MATNPCGTDTSLEDIKAAQEELNSIASGGANALAAINSKVSEIGNKLNSFKPEVEESPNLQKEMAKLQSADPITASGIIQGIKETFGPLVDNINELIDEVAPGLSEASDKVSENPFDLSALNELLSLKPSASAVCSTVKNIEVKTLPDGTQTTAEKPAPPAVPQTVPEPEPIKQPQTLREQNEEAMARVIWLESSNATRQTLLNVYKKRPKPPEITDLEFKKQSNRFWSNYTFLYIAYGNSIEPTVTPAGGLNDWPWRETWAPLEIARDPDYIGEPPIGEEILYDLHTRLYNENNTTDISFIEATQLWYDKASEEQKIGIGVGKPFFKEI